MPEKHMNVFTLKMGGMTDFSYRRMDYIVTSDEPFDVPFFGALNGIGTININAGRHGSRNIADWFYRKFKLGRALGCCTNSPKPDKVNFALYGDIHFRYEGLDYVARNIAVAQGHRKTKNNWWLGGPNFNKNMFVDLEMVDKNGSVAPCPCDSAYKMLQILKDGNSTCSMIMLLA